MADDVHTSDHRSAASFDRRGDDDVARAAAREVVRQLGQAGVRSGTIVEIGCGTGVTAAALREAGYDVLGLDIDDGILAVARRRAPDVRFVAASPFDLDLPSCVAVVSVGRSVNEVIAPDTSTASVADLVERLHAALEPGGLLMLDVAAPDVAPPGHVEERIVDGRIDGRRHTVLDHSIVGPDGRTIDLHTVVFREDDDGRFHRTDLRRRMLLQPLEVVTEFLLDAGFDVVVMSGYADVTFAPGVTGFLARKPGVVS